MTGLRRGWERVEAGELTSPGPGRARCGSWRGRFRSLSRSAWLAGREDLVAQRIRAASAGFPGDDERPGAIGRAAKTYVEAAPEDARTRDRARALGWRG